MDRPQITSRQNQRVKEALLLRQRKWRSSRHQFLIDGAREINRALAAGIVPRQAFVCEPFCRDDESRTAAQRLAASSANVYLVIPEVFEKLTFGDREDGLVVIAEAPQRGLIHLQLSANPLVAVVDAVEKPGNLGAILRSADAAGVEAVIVTGGGTDLYNPNTIRASLGTVFRQNLCAAPTADVIRWLREQGLAVMAAYPGARQSLFDVDLRGPTALVLGSEAEGLSSVWQAPAMASIRLPMLGIADSLNVSATAAILFYEALRQRMER